VYEGERLETESILFYNGYAHSTGLSDNIYAKQSTPDFKIKRKYYTCEFVGCESDQIGQVINWKLKNFRKKGFFRTQTFSFLDQ